MSTMNKPQYFSKKELEECSNKTYKKLKVYLPKCKETVYLSVGTDDWGVHFVSYGDMDKMTELVNLILEWKHKANQFDKNEREEINNE